MKNKFEDSSENKFENLNSNIPVILNEKFSDFSSNIRLSIMLILNTQKKVKITELAQLFNISSGKLDHHIKILEKEKLLIKRMFIFPNRTQSIIEATKKGRSLLNEYLLSIKEILKLLEI